MEPIAEVDIDTHIKRISAIIALHLLKAARRVGGVLFFVLHHVGRIVSPVGGIFLKHLILPIYKLTITTRLRIQRLALPARGFVIFLVSNRYLFHTTLGIMAAVTFAANISTRQAHAQDVGQKSLLFALATDQHRETIEETVRPETFAKDTHYLESSAMVYVPNIDFDYDIGEDVLTDRSFAIPGTVAAAPIDLTEASKAPRTKTETYIVKENDTIGSIANEFGVNIGSILWNNNLTERQYIRPGDNLRIPPVSGMLVTVKKGDSLTKLASTYTADQGDILAFNNLSADSALVPGSELIIPGGRPPVPVQNRVIVAMRRESPVPSRAQPATPAARSVVAAVADNELLEGGDAGSTGVTKPDDLEASNMPKTRLLWPTSGRVITQYYGWRHTGIDIDGDFSSPIYASEDGTVEQAGWNSAGYGLMILISHPNGYITRYAHSSKMFVKVGDEVKKGQVIAMVGTTGRSTGTHLHYEVYVNGRRSNPLTYIK